jgi:glycosyltransferase involved in cell wall biosynthesis
MKLLISAKFYVEGGIERVLLSLLEEWIDILDLVVVILPPKKISSFQEIFRNRKNIIFEPSDWRPKSLGTRQLKLLSYLRKLSSYLGLIDLEKWCSAQADWLHSSGYLRFLVQKYGCTHCLYPISNQVQVPEDIGIPVATICHDLFWRFAPLTYPQSFIEKYDASLLEWLIKANQIITVSHKTRSDLIGIFPGYEDKVKAIPSASDRPLTSSEKAHLQIGRLNSEKSTTFFYPSSFSLYKDHLTLMQASTELYRIDSGFQVLMTGRDTNCIAEGDFNLSKQKSTHEYDAYVSSLEALYIKHQDIWKLLFLGLGYCDLATVEAAYQSCQCVVMPSRYEGFGLAVAEAIVRGIPVIASDIEVFREQVNIYQCEDRVFFFEPGNVNALKSCLQDFLGNPLPRLMPDETVKRFGHWTWRTVAEQYIECLSLLK